MEMVVYSEMNKVSGCRDVMQKNVESLAFLAITNPCLIRCLEGGGEMLGVSEGEEGSSGNQLHR